MRVLVTGALGFLGSAAARAFVARGDTVLGVDNRLPRGGAHDRNLHDVRTSVALTAGDARDGAALAGLLPGADVVVHAAGHVSHTAGLADPTLDVEHNVRATAVLLDAVRAHAPGCRVVYLSTRGVYGAARALPVAETHPCAPRGVHEWSKLAAEECVRTYGRVHGVAGVVLRLTNVVGRGAQLRNAESGVVNWWLGRALRGESVPVFGDGAVRRDVVGVDDAADAVVRAAVTPGIAGEVFNVGDARSYSLAELAHAVVRAAGAGQVAFVPYTRARGATEVGDFATDATRARDALGWAPRTTLDDALARAAGFYRAHGDEYA